MRGWLSAARQVSTGPIDSVTVSVRFLGSLSQDLGGAGLSSPDQAELTLLGSPVTSQQYSELMTTFGLVPAGTRSIDLSLNFTRQTGFILNASVDNLALELSNVPEPSTFGLIAAGCAALVLAGRKNSREA